MTFLDPGELADHAVFAIPLVFDTAGLERRPLLGFHTDAVAHILEQQDLTPVLSFAFVELLGAGLVCVGIDSARRTGRTLLPSLTRRLWRGENARRLYDIDSVQVVKERVKEPRPAILPW